MVHQRGIEVSRRSIGAINKIVAPTNKTELQSLIGKVNFIRRFISNLSGKIHAFSPLLKLKADQEFVWGKEQQLALLGILNIITKSRLSSLNLVTVPKMPNLSLTPLKASCHPQHDMRDAVLKYAIALLNK